MPIVCSSMGRLLRKPLTPPLQAFQKRRTIPLTRKRSLNQRLRGADDEIQFHRRSTNSNLNREREPGLNGTKHDYTFSIRVHNGCFTGRTGRNYGCASSSSLLFVTCIVCRVSARSRQVSELVP